MDLIQDLQRQGWYLSENGIKECSKSDSVSVQEIIKEALNTDLKQIGEKHLPESLGKSKSEFVDGPFVLQVQKIRNVAIPKDAEHSDGGQKLYRLSLTDGPGTCTAVDMKGISGLSHNTPPGSKVKLLGRVPISHGFLLLNNSNCKLLGGRVEKLVESWELKRSLATQNRVVVNRDGGPPPFIPFGQRRKDVDQTSNKRDTFRSLDSVAKRKETDGEFEQQRKAIIEAALQEGRTKGFASISSKQVQAQDRSVASLVDMGFSVDQANVALKKCGGNLEAAVSTLVGEQSYSPSSAHSARRSTDSRHSSSQSNRPQLLVNSERSERSGGGRRGGRSEETEDYGADQHTRPSAPATLFDFVTTIIPKKPDKTSSKPSNSVSAEPTTGKRQEERLVESGDAGKKQRQKSPEGPGGDHGTREESSREKLVVNPPSTNQSGGGAEPNYHNAVQNLPPRLQKKQMREEEEKMYKAAGKDTAAINDWTRDRLSNRVYDVNSRGTITNKNLWMDDKDDRSKDRRDRRGGGGGGRGMAEDGRPGEKERSSNEKMYERNTNNGAAYQGPYADASVAQQQPLQVVLEVAPLVNCTPCTVPPLMQCTTDVQLVQSMSALHLYPATAMQLGPTFVPGLAAVSPSVICDGAADNVSKENARWKAGDMCLAKWEDKEFYRAKVLRADPNGAVVNFIDYGNDVSRLPYSDLRPMRSDGGGGGGAWYTSGGILYPGSAVEHGTNIIYPSRNGHLSAAPVPGAPTQGMIVQGPGSYPLDHTYRIITNTGRSMNGQKQTKRSTDKQLYVPPAQRK